MSWIIQGNQLVNTENTFDMPQSEVVSECVWKVNGNTLRTGILPDDMLVGAFANANHLKKVTIPESVSYIGNSAFKNTALSSVKISSDCTYGSESFPENCNVEFY